MVGEPSLLTKIKYFFMRFYGEYVRPFLIARKLNDQIRAALLLAFEYGGIDGAHHKQWIINRMVQELTGDQYDDWVKWWNSDDDCTPWDTGIAP